MNTVSMRTMRAVCTVLTMFTCVQVCMYTSVGDAHGVDRRSHVVTSVHGCLHICLVVIDGEDGDVTHGSVWKEE